MTGAPVDRLLEAIRALILQIVQPYRYHGLYRYTVTAANLAAQTATLTPHSPTMPALAKIPLRVGIPGAFVQPDVGTVCYVSFADGDPSQPVIVAYDQTGGLVRFDDGNAKVSRVGDHGNTGTLTLVQTNAQTVTFTYTNPDSVTTIFTLAVAAGLTAAGVLSVPLTTKLTEGADNTRA